MARRTGKIFRYVVVEFVDHGKLNIAVGGIG